MWFLRIWASLSGATGVFLVGLAFRNVARGSASRGWPRTEGRVVRSFVLVDNSDEGGEGYTPQVEYEYSVDGVTYRAMRLQFGRTGSWSRERAERVIAPYTAGSGVPVFFN